VLFGLDTDQEEFVVSGLQGAVSRLERWATPGDAG
jgi:hypothetical protein